MRRTRFASELLDVAAIEPDGLLVGEDGLYVRYLQVGAVNPLVVDQAEGEGISSAFTQVAGRLPDRQSLQLYVQATPLALEETLAGETQRSSRLPGRPRTLASTCAPGRSAASGSARSSPSETPPIWSARCR